jgi:hypothetical protein
MIRITVPNILLRTSFEAYYDWKCTQTYFQQYKIIKEFYKFDGNKPVDRIFVSYNKDLPISDETIIKCLDEVSNRWLECCFIDNGGHTRTIISSYEYIATKDGVETYLTFGNQYYLK